MDLVIAVQVFMLPLSHDSMSKRMQCAVFQWAMITELCYSYNQSITTILCCAITHRWIGGTLYFLICVESL